ncbi:MAG TPA: sulfite exporter TauE/SafE family protein [Xanthobacteraceae bacterium]|nr:sulfite exporter TauE/SafE family protein [Xanthobacteraceae bacterium]
MDLITDPLFYPLAVIAVTALGLGKGGFAGVGVIATPLLATILPPLQAAAILLPILIVQDTISIWVYRRDWSAWHLRVMLPGGILGIAIAWALATQVSDAFVRLVVGAIGVSFALNAWFGRQTGEARQPSVPAGLFWGTIAGFTSTLSQAGGPPFQVYVLPQRLPKLTLVGTYTIYFAALNWLKIGPYFALGQFSAANLANSLILLPVAIAANFLGIWLVRRTPTGLFYQIAYVLVFLISLELIRSGAMTLLKG